jgi:hypothetical protein
MPIDEKAGLTGLVTNVAETQAPPGTLIEAENVVVRRPGCIEPRDGLQLVASVGTGFPAYGFSWRSKDFIQRNNGSHVFNWIDTAGATYRYTDPFAGLLDPQPLRRDVFSRAEARANLYLPYDAGGLKMETDAGPWLAAGLPLIAFLSSHAFSASGTWLGANEQVAYRVVAVRTDANGLSVRSVPSGAYVVNNTGAATAVQISVGSWNSSLFSTIEVYRTRNFPSSVTPDEEYQLVATLPSNAFMHLDLVLPAARGVTLYTSPSRGGADEANGVPPAAACVALFKNSLFFANVRSPRRITVSYGAVGSRTGSATGLGFRAYTATTTIGSPNLTLLSSTVGLEKGMVLISANTPANAHVTNISGTTVTISANATASGAGVSCDFRDAVNLDGTWFDIFAFNSLTPLGGFHLLKITPPEGGYANTTAVSRYNAAATARTIQATHGGEFTPVLPGFDGTPRAMDQDAWPGGIVWSKPDEPEHVRPIDFAFVGDQGKAILALIPTRDALYILKEDGIFRLTGANGSWRVDPFDPTARCVLPSSARAVRGRGVFLGDRGVAMVSDDGVEMISAPVNDLVKPVIDQILANWLSTGFYELPGMAGTNVACVFERESEYTLARGSTVAPLVFNDITGAWTTLAYYGHANEALSYKALFNFERAGHCVLSLGATYYKTLLSTDAGADYLRYDRLLSVTVNSYSAPNATLSFAINALEDDVIKDSAGRYWRVTANVNFSATVPVVLGVSGGTAAMATGVGTYYRSLRCSVTATGFAQPTAAQKRSSSFLTSWTKFVGPVRLRYAFQSSEDANWTEDNAKTSLVESGGGGNGYANYGFGLAPSMYVPHAHARAWLLRARIRWAQVFGDAQLEAISAELTPMTPGSPQNVRAA